MVDTTQWTTAKSDRLEQFKLIYDYIKFHIGLYVATPPVFAVVAESFQVEHEFWFKIGLTAMILIYLVSGANAAAFMARHINDAWSADWIDHIESGLFSGQRRFMHHTLYWIGLACGLVGLFAPIVIRHCH